MKLKYLSKPNCSALLPIHIGVPLIRELDNYLHYVNVKDQRNKGIIDKLIKHNEKTIGRLPGSNRYFKYDIDISNTTDLWCKSFQTLTLEKRINDPVKLHLTFIYQDGTYWKIILPLQFLLKGWGDANEGYQCYVHTITENLDPTLKVNLNNPQPIINKDEYYYVGITGRNWLKRFDEHLSDMRRGSRKWFHSKLRESIGVKNVLYVSSLMDINHNKDDAMLWEEIAVDRWASDQYGLNMIPGGYKGLKYLHEHRIIKQIDISLEEREIAIAEYARQNPRKGIPNPMLAALWEDDDFYKRINEAHPKRLSEQQVLRIRELHGDEWAIPHIVNEVGALNEKQVKDVIKGNTYNRIQSDKK